MIFSDTKKVSYSCFLKNSIKNSNTHGWKFTDNNFPLHKAPQNVNGRHQEKFITMHAVKHFSRVIVLLIVYKKWQKFYADNVAREMKGNWLRYDKVSYNATIFNYSPAKQLSSYFIYVWKLTQVQIDESITHVLQKGFFVSFFVIRIVLLH